MIKKDISPRNNKGEYHGYCELYWGSGNLKWKGVMVNNRMTGYFEQYHENGIKWEYGTGYWIDGKKVSDDNNKKGYCIIFIYTTILAITLNITIPFIINIYTFKS